MFNGPCTSNGQLAGLGNNRLRHNSTSGWGAQKVKPVLVIQGLPGNAGEYSSASGQPTGNNSRKHRLVWACWDSITCTSRQRHIREGYQYNAAGVHCIFVTRRGEGMNVTTNTAGGSSVVHMYVLSFTPRGGQGRRPPSVQRVHWGHGRRYQCLSRPGMLVVRQ